MKYTLIILMIITQALSLKIIDKTAATNSGIEWTRTKTTVYQYKYEILTIYDEPVEIPQVPIYIKLDRTNKLVNYYLFLTSDETKLLGLGKTDLTVPGLDVQVHVFQVSMLNVNTKLSMFFRSEPHGEFFYYLDNINFIEPFMIDEPTKKILEKFEGLETNENIKNILEFTDNNGMVKEDIQKLIAKERNIKLKSIYTNWKLNHDLKTFRELLVILNLSNRKGVMKSFNARKWNINKILFESSKKYKTLLQASNSNLFETELYKYIKLFTDENSGKAVGPLKQYNKKINTMVNALINQLADIAMKEYTYFAHGGEVTLFLKYLTGKYLKFRGKRLFNLFKMEILTFAKYVFSFQVTYLSSHQNPNLVDCKIKVDFILSLRNAFNDFLKKQPCRLLNRWKDGILGEVNDFSDFKAPFEKQIVKYLEGFFDATKIDGVSLKEIELKDIKDAKENFQNRTYIEMSEFQKHKREKVQGSDEICNYADDKKRWKTNNL
jgi:hypothetical protein